MKTLDRYIIRTFLINFTILFVVLMSLFVVVDLIVDLDEFLEAGAFWGQKRNVAQLLQGTDADPELVTEALTDHADAGTLQRTFGVTPEIAERLVNDTEPGGLASAVGTVVKLIDYYAPLVVLLYVFFSGLLVTAGMGFTLTAMQRTRELTAIVASGVSLYRVAAPIVVVGILLNATTLVAQEWIIPAVAPKLARTKSQVEHEAIENFPVRFASDGSGNLFSAAEYDPKRQTMTGATIVEREPSGQTRRLINAERATWDEAAGGWRLENAYADRPSAQGVGYVDRETLTFVPSKLTPPILLARRAEIYSRLLPLRELQDLQSNSAVDPAQKASITQIIWSRFSLLVLNVLILVMGLPFFLLRSPPQNALVQGIKAAMLCMGAWGGGLVALQVTTGLLNPVAAAWLPVVIYLPVSAILLQTVKT